MWPPKLAITMGDVAGIGPEVIVRACCDARVSKSCRPLVVGDPHVLERAAQLVGSTLRIVEVADARFIEPDERTLTCWNPCDIDATGIGPAAVDPRAGRAAYEYLRAAAEAALDGRMDALVTAPLNKAALSQAGLEYPGHTEILADLCDVDEFAMMLYLPPDSGETGDFGLAVAHVTLHTSIASVPGLLSMKNIQASIRLLNRFLVDMGCPSPRIAVCALNPHAGEQGLFGDEEDRMIAPAVDAARRSEIDVSGPLPADTGIQRAAAGEFDGVVAMYHDQGHIALKLIEHQRAVNVTLGLPIVRTSPSHGTAFDIAWSGQADSIGMVEAIRVATLLARKRNESTVSS